MVSLQLTCKMFRGVDPGSLGRFLGDTLKISLPGGGRSVWIKKERRDRQAIAKFEGVEADLLTQLEPLMKGEIMFKGEPIVAAAVSGDAGNETLPEESSAAKRIKKAESLNIESQCLPWLSKPYPGQLSLKRELVLSTLKEALAGVKSKAKKRGYIDPIEWTTDVPPTLTHGELNGYRNKCEFTIGLNAADEPDIGFILTRATQTCEPVIAPGEGLLHVPPAIADIVSRIRTLVRKSINEFPLFSHVTKIGCWRMAAIRLCPGTLQSQLIIQSGPIDNKEAFERLLTEAGLGVTSLYVQYNASVTDTTSMSPLHDLKLLSGPATISMRIGNTVSLAVHPLSFFQTNSAVCDLLYNQVFGWATAGAAAEADSLLLDVCCGVGSIGQYILKKSLPSSGRVKIVGIDIVETAIENAIENATANGLTEGDFEYIAGRAEIVLPDYFANPAHNDGANVIAVVDPPRVGLHTSVLRALRDNEQIQKIVYVSCNPKSLADDLVLLCEPLASCADEEGVAVNHRFVPVKAVAADMFPHTPHCEVVVLLQRPKP